MVLWWLVFNLNKITWENLLLWQGITQHVPTIIIFILKAGGRLLWKRQRERPRHAFTGNENTYVCRQTCFLHHPLSDMFSLLQHLNLTLLTYFLPTVKIYTHGIYFIFSSFFRLFMQFSTTALLILSQVRIPNKQLPLARWQKSVLAFMLKACLHSSDSLPISFVSHGLERPQVLGHVQAEQSCHCESGIHCYKVVE